MESSERAPSAALRKRAPTSSAISPGQALLVTLYDQILKAGVKVYEEWYATALYMEDGACRGLVALEMVTGELHLLRAKAVIVAAGGLGRVYEPSTNALICTGDGYALAYRAGAPLDGHGDGAVPSDDARRQRFPDDRSCARRGRLSAQLAGRALHEDATRPTRWSSRRATLFRAPKRWRSPKAAASTETSCSIAAILAPTSS